MARNLGKMGEDKFSALCASAGLICNSSIRDDQAGWDFYVEFPHNINLAVYADKEPQPIGCKIQVKATDNLKKQISITLSNLLRLVHDAMPVFIFFIEFNGLEEPQNAYLVHIDKLIITDVLKKARQLSLDRDVERKLNKKGVTIKYDISQKLPLITGDYLKKEIEKYVPLGMDKYISDKKYIVNTVGYDKGGCELHFKTNTRESFYKITKALLGSSERIDVNNTFLYNVRFDIKDVSNDFKNESAKIEFQTIEPSGAGYLVVKNKQLNKKLRFDCDLYITPLQLELPDGSCIMRLSCEMFDFYIKNNGSMEYSFKLHNKTIDVKDLKNSTELVNWIFFDEHGLVFEINNHKHSEPLISHTSPVKRSDISEKNTWVKALYLTTSATRIINHTGSGVSLKTSLTELFDNETKIKQIIHILDNNAKAINFSFSTNEKIKSYKNKTACCVIALKIALGEFYFIFTSALIGDLTFKEERYYVIPTNLSNEGVFHFHKNECISDEIKISIEDICVKYKSMGYVVVDCYVEAAL